MVWNTALTRSRLLLRSFSLSVFSTFSPLSSFSLSLFNSPSPPPGLLRVGEIMYTNITGKREKHSCCLREEREEGGRYKKNKTKERARDRGEEIITACVLIPAPTLIVKKSESWENSPQYADALWCCHSRGVGHLIRPCLRSGGTWPRLASMSH